MSNHPFTLLAALTQSGEHLIVIQGLDCYYDEAVKKVLEPGCSIQKTKNRRTVSDREGR